MRRMKSSSLDYTDLRREGIRHLEKMIGQEWTDFNAHDPGITILEQVCYAMTDLGYRAAFDLPDLLAEGGEDWAKEFYRPSEVLTTHPVTINDIRKLAMDVDGVKNAWVERVTTPTVPLFYHPGKKQLSTEEEPPASQPLEMKGLYKVWIEKSDLSDIDGSIIQQDVTRRLHSHRGLCEDFEDILVLNDIPVKVSARIEIGPVEDAEALLVEIYARLENFISPRIRFYSLQEMLAIGKSVDEIFDGPMLEHGFIDTENLAGLERHESIYSSDLIQEIMSVEGVRAVRNIGIATSSGGTWEPWRVKLPDSDPPLTPKFDLSGSDIVLQREQLEVSVDSTAVNVAYTDRLKGATLFNKLTAEERDILPPAGRHRNVGNYHSILHQFPQNYGVGTAGLSSSATPQRRAQAQQLKAYLLFFDQQLANLFSQLSHARDLFSFQGDGDKSYFSNMINDVELDLAPLRCQQKDDHRETLQLITETGIQQGRSGDRRNRFLNHLLARFAEHFTDYSLLLQGATPEGGPAPTERLIKDKEAFLQNYPKISAGRGCGFNYLEPFGADNTSGLQDRIRLKLGLSDQDEEIFFVVEHILLRAMNGDQQQEIPFLAATRSKDPYSLQLSFVFADWPERFMSPGFRRLVEQTVRDETPAHLTIYTHWLTKDAMNSFEMVYRDWLTKLRNNG